MMKSSFVICLSSKWNIIRVLLFRRSSFRHVSNFVRSVRWLFFSSVLASCVSSIVSNWRILNTTARSRHTESIHTTDRHSFIPPSVCLPVCLFVWHTVLWVPLFAINLCVEKTSKTSTIEYWITSFSLFSFHSSHRLVIAFKIIFNSRKIPNAAI